MREPAPHCVSCSFLPLSPTSFGAPPEKPRHLPPSIPPRYHSRCSPRYALPPPAPNPGRDAHSAPSPAAPTVEETPDHGQVLAKRQRAGRERMGIIYESDQNRLTPAACGHYISVIERRRTWPTKHPENTTALDFLWLEVMRMFPTTRPPNGGLSSSAGRTAHIAQNAVL